MDRHKLEVLNFDNGYCQVKGERLKILFIIKSIRYKTKRGLALDLYGELMVAS